MTRSVGAMVDVDGVALATDIFRAPSPNGLVALIRTPYGRSRYTAQAKAWTAQGFSLVVQDVRGRHDSPGTWLPYVHESADSAATFAWLADQPWCDGIVAIGSSYEAATAWAGLAADQSGSVVGIISKVPTLGTGRVKLEPSGLLRYQEHVSWWLTHGGSRTSREQLSDACGNTAHNAIAALPRAAVLDRLGLSASWQNGFEEAFLAANALDVTHDEVVSEKHLEHAHCPSLHIGGWRDLQVSETARHHAAASRGGPPGQSSLVIGDWGHDLGSSARDPYSASHQQRWLTALAAREPLPPGRTFDRGCSEWLPSDVTTADEEFPAGVHRDASPAPIALHLTPEGGLAWERAEFAGMTTAWSPSAHLDGIPPTEWVWHTAPLPRSLTLRGHPRLQVEVQVPHDPLDWIVVLHAESAAGQTYQATYGSSPSGTEDARVEIAMHYLATTLLAGTRLTLTLTHERYPLLAPPLRPTGSRFSTTSADRREWTARIDQGRLDLPVTHPEGPHHA